MTTFVLVHGAWGGSYGWRGFANLLRKDGHEVYTPSLTGLGERSHLGGPDVNLTTHITDVENVFRYEGLSDVVLVGHSYGGMVVTGLADRIPELISHLVYSDAFLPRDGESCFDLGGAGGKERAQIEDDWKVLSAPTSLENATVEQLRQAGLRAAQPLKTLTEGVRLKTPLEERDFSLTYIKALQPPRDPARIQAFWAASDRTRNDPRWRYYEMPTGHGTYREMPERFREILYEAAGLTAVAAKGG
ncbi:MAG TPA: alpha/beta hydrolase [Dehalococcoidia bacterium]|nr:alpha/beta hydrolase [Dehalococcoidia bacterium]